MRLTLRHSEGTVRAEAAAGGPVAWVRRLAVDRGQPAVARLGVDAGRGVQQRPGIGVTRIRQQLLGWAFLHDLSGIHHQDALADIRYDTEVVADQDHRSAEVAVELAQQFQDLRLDGHIQGGCRFIGDQQGWLVGKPHRQHHPLAHSACILMSFRATNGSGSRSPARWPLARA